MSKFVSIAIDGPAGAGKSTMARACAQALGYLYVDTGAIYRTVGYYMRLMGVGPKDKDGIARLIDEVNIDIRYEDGVQHMILNGADVTGEIRTPEMSMYASGVSAQPCVRAFLLDMQRQLARTHNVVMDGRDIGTVVLPKADVKIFRTPCCLIPPAIRSSSRSMPFWISSGGSSGELLVPSVLVAVPHRAVFLAPGLSCDGPGADPGGQLHFLRQPLRHGRPHLDSACPA